MRCATTRLALLIGASLLASALIVPAELRDLLGGCGLGLILITVQLHEQLQREAHTREVLRHAAEAHRRARSLLGR